MAIPLDAVRGTLRITASEISLATPGASVLHDEKAIAFVPLATALDGTPWSVERNWAVVVVAGADGMAAIGVERLFGTAKIVVRPLPQRMTARRDRGGGLAGRRRQPATRARSREPHRSRSARRAGGLDAQAPRAAGPRRRRFADDPHARAEHPRIGRLRRRPRRSRRRRRLERRDSATRCSSSTSRCPAWTASPSSSASGPIPSSRDIPAILVTSRNVARGPAARARRRRARLHRQERVRPGRAARHDQDR